MKRAIQWVLQQMLGSKRYLCWLARWQLFTRQYLFRDKEFLHFLSLIPESGIVGDIGANLGITAVNIAKNKPSCKIVAFEPVPMNFYCCKELVTKMQANNVVLYELALADCPGQLMMMIPEERGVMMHGLSKVVETPANNTHMLDVRALSLDEIPEFTLPNQVVALKIDVENFEWYVLQGAVGVIAAQKPIIFCEVWNTIRRELTFDLMRKLGYDIWVFDGKKLVPFEDQQALNFFFLPNTSSIAKA